MQDVIKAQSFQESYFWTQQTPATLLPQHCFGLPATDLSLQDAIEHPIRLRQTKLKGPLIGIIVACMGGQLLGLETCQKPNSYGELYKQLDRLRLDGTVIWLYHPLQRDESIIEICVRRLQSEVRLLCEDSIVVSSTVDCAHTY